MIGVNIAAVSGTVARDPKVFNVGNTRKANFTVNVPSTYRDKDGNEKSVSDFVNVVAWGKKADEAEHLHAGDSVAIQGRIRGSSYEKDGGKVFVQELDATVIQVERVESPSIPY